MQVASDDAPGLLPFSKLYSYTDQGIKVDKKVLGRLYKTVSDYLDISFAVLIGIVCSMAPALITTAQGEKPFTGFIHIRRLLYFIFHKVAGPAHLFVANQTKVGSCIICKAEDNLIRHGPFIHALSGVAIVTQKLFNKEAGAKSSLSLPLYYTAWSGSHSRNIDAASYQSYIENQTSSRVYVLQHPDFTYEHPHIHVIDRARVIEILRQDFINAYHSWKFLRCGRLRRGAGDNYTPLGAQYGRSLYSLVDWLGKSWILARSMLYVLGYLPGLPVLDDKDMDAIPIWTHSGMQSNALFMEMNSLLESGAFPVSHVSQIEEKCTVIKVEASFTDQLDPIDLS